MCVPAAALVELALRAGDETGADRIGELTVEAPLVVPESGGVQLQVTAADGAVHVYARPDDGAERPWTRHATGTLVAAGGAPPGRRPHRLAPAVAEPVPAEGHYDRLAATGLDHGPAFRGLRAAWRLGDELYAEVELPEEARPDADRFGIHPRCSTPRCTRTSPSGTSRCSRPAGPRSPCPRPARPRCGCGSPARGGPGADRRRPVGPAGRHRDRGAGAGPAGRAPRRPRPGPRRAVPARVDPLPAPGPAPRRPGELGAARCRHPALTGGWAELDIPGKVYADVAALGSAVDAAEPVPDVVLLPCVPGGAGDDLAEAVHAETLRVLGLLQVWLAEPRWEATRLVVLTSGAVATRPDEDVPALAQSAVWGLVRSAQAENPGRILLLDVADDPAPVGGLAGAVATAVAADETQAAVRAGALLAPGWSAASRAPPTSPPGTRRSPC
ncbi:polyketide synthase dehydratase domain-containing protein [Streptomyces sp. M19]